MGLVIGGHACRDKRCCWVYHKRSGQRDGDFVFSIDIADKLVIHTATGTISLEDIAVAMRSWFDHPDFNADIPVLWDLRAVTFDVTDESLQEWTGKTLPITNQLRAGRKTALVLPSSESAQAAVEILGSHDWQNKVRIFQNDYEAAQAWLTSPIH